MSRGRVNRLRESPDAGRAFSLVELVMVIAIISIIAAIAVPRISHAGKDAQANATLQTLECVRDAIDHYFAEHGQYPGYNPANSAANGTWFINQLTQYSDADGNVQTTPSADYPYGPYLRTPFPTNPYNGLSNVRAKSNHTGSITLGASGWITVISDGTFTLNADSNTLPIDAFTKVERETMDAVRTGL